MKILVTGGMGLVGPWVTRRLVEEGYRPVVYDNRVDTAFMTDIMNEVDVVVGDTRDLAHILRTLKEHQIERIIHLAALMPDACEANPLAAFEVNTLGTINVFEAARLMGIEKVIYTSSKGVFGPFVGDFGYPAYKPVDEDYPYVKNPKNFGTILDATKIACELVGGAYSKKWGLQFIALRFSSIYGPGKKARHGALGIVSKLIENAMLGKPTTIVNGGDEKNDFIYVKDVANGVVRACLSPNSKHYVYNIGTGQAVRLADLAAAVRKVYPEAAIEIGPGLNYMGVGPIYCVFENSRARNDLGYAPKFTLPEGVKDYIETMQRHNVQPTYSP